jgi:predicted lipid-binding transport protein (Tim44 family)
LTDLTPEKDGRIVVDMEDEVFRGATVCKDGETTWPPPAPKLSAAPAKPKPAPAPVPVVEDKKKSVTGLVIGMVVAGLALLGLGAVAPASFMAHFTVFVLACFVGHHYRRPDSDQFRQRIDQVGGDWNRINHEHQHRGRFRRNPAHARNVQEVRPS